MDAVFYTMPDESVVAMVSGDIGIYGVPPESAGGTPGWDSSYASKDLDELPWFWAMAPVSDVGQLVGRDLGYCSSCEPTSVDANGLAVVASMDVAMNWLYGRPDVGSVRAPGKYDCHAENMTAGGRGVALVDDGAGGATVWVVRLQQSSGEPVRQNLFKGVLAAGDDFEDGEWCYETTGKNKNTTTKWAFDGDDAVCARDDVLPGSYDWPPCDPSNPSGIYGELFDGMPSGNSLGSPTDVDVLRADPNVAVVSFASYTGDTDYDGGLAVFYDDGGEMDVFQVPGFTGQASCSSMTMNQVFHHEGARVAIDQARSEWTSDTEFDLWIYVSAAAWGAAAGDDCAVYEVNVSYASGITASWTPVDIGSALGSGDCSDLTVDAVHGLATAPWAPGTVWVFGDSSGTGALCQVDVDSDVPSNSTWTGLAPSGGKDRRVKRVRPHPHLEDTLIVGTSALTTTNPDRQYEPGGLYQVAWRLNGVTGEVVPEWRPFPAEGLSNPNVNGIAFDVVEDTEPYEVEAFWLSTSGSGVYEGLRQWD